MSDGEFEFDSGSEFSSEETSGAKSVGDLEEENRRLKLQLENARLELELAQQKSKLKALAGQVDPDGPIYVEPRPKSSGGSPVPRPPINPGVARPPQQGDEVNVSCRSGAKDGMGNPCPGRKAILKAKIGGKGGPTGGSARRVIYQCTTCSQSWNVTY